MKNKHSLKNVWSFLLGGALLANLLLPNAAEANVLTPQDASYLTSFTYSSYSVVNEVNVTISNAPGENGYFGSGQVYLYGAAGSANHGQTLAVWCLDDFHDLQWSARDSIIKPKDTSGGNDVAPYNLGTKLTTTQYTEIGQLVHWGDKNISKNYYNSSAVQLAIWMVEYSGASFRTNTAADGIASTLVYDVVHNTLGKLPSGYYMRQVVSAPGINNQGMIYEIAAVPVPAALPLFASSLFVFGALLHRRARKAQVEA